MSLLDTPISRARIALDLLKCAPSAFGGLVLRARAGSAHAQLLEHLTHLPRVRPGLDSVALFGGLDAAESLQAGKAVYHKGLLANSPIALVTQAESLHPTRAAELAQAMDQGNAFIFLDEGAASDEAIPEALLHRCAFWICLEGVSCLMPPESLDPVAAYPSVEPHPSWAASLAITAAGLEISSIRAPLFALRAAHALAKSGRYANADDILTDAAVLTMSHHRQTASEVPETSPPPPPTDQEHQKDDAAGHTQPQDMLLEAQDIVLPEALLDMAPKRRARATGSGSGAEARSSRRGRPMPSRPGTTLNGKTLDIPATLAAAAPWQRLRGRTDRVLFHRSDLRIKHYQKRTDRVLIFAVDASGSAAVARLAEAKGAVNLLLGRAYAARDHIALLSFRGTEAKLLLPPTRSLVAAKRRLSALPGGGGTPLAAALTHAESVAERVRSQGQTPVLILLTDGRANVALDGTGDRALATEQADQAAQNWAARDFQSLCLDTARRPSATLKGLAQRIRAQYLPLPGATAKQLAQRVQQALD